MNWADLSFVATPLVCALSAGTAASEAKMGWFSLLFAVGGFAIGYGFGVLARRLGLLMLFAGCKQTRSIVTFGLLMAYMLVPMFVMIAGFGVAALLSTWIARHFV
jgi:hypothetical protein